MDNPTRRLPNPHPTTECGRLAQAGRNPFRRLLSRKKSGHVDAAIVRPHLPTARSPASLRPRNLPPQHHASRFAFVGRVLCRGRPRHRRKRRNHHRSELDGSDIRATRPRLAQTRSQFHQRRAPFGTPLPSGSFSSGNTLQTRIAPAIPPYLLILLVILNLTLKGRIPLIFGPNLPSSHSTQRISYDG